MSVLRSAMLAEELHAQVTSPRGTIEDSKFKDTTNQTDYTGDVMNSPLNLKPKIPEVTVVN